MPTATWYPLADGTYRGWHDLSNGVEAWRLVNPDFDGGDSDYFRLGAPAALPDDDGRVSFRVHQVGLDRVKPTSVTLTVRGHVIGFGSADPNMHDAGFVDSNGTLYLSGSPHVADGEPSPLDAVFTFATSPVTGSAWTLGGLAGLEPVVAMTYFVNLTKFLRVLRVTMTATYENMHGGRRLDSGAVMA